MCKRKKTINTITVGLATFMGTIFICSLFMSTKETTEITSYQPTVKTDTILINEFKTLDPNKITDPDYSNKLCYLFMLSDELGDLTTLDKESTYCINWTGSCYLYTFINDSVLIVKSK